MTTNIVIYAKKIHLTRGKHTLVGYWWYEWLNQWKWFAFFDTWNWYARRNVYIENKKQRGYLMHRAIHHAKKGELVDHADVNGLNNLPHNARKCEHKDNVLNCRKRKTKCTSIYKGVGYRTTGLGIKRWTAMISLNKKCYYIGIFLTEKEAALAYNKKAIELHGEFASINNVS